MFRRCNSADSSAFGKILSKLGILALLEKRLNARLLAVFLPEDVRRRLADLPVDGSIRIERMVSPWLVRAIGEPLPMTFAVRLRNR